MRGIAGLSVAAVMLAAAGAGMAAMHAPLGGPAPRPAPDPEPHKKARRVAAKLTSRRMHQRFGNDMPMLDNHAAKLMGLPHQGTREMARRVKQMAKREEKLNGRP